MSSLQKTKSSSQATRIIFTKPKSRMTKDTVQEAFFIVHCTVTNRRRFRRGFSWESKISAHVLTIRVHVRSTRIDCKLTRDKRGAFHLWDALRRLASCRVAFVKIGQSARGQCSSNESLPCFPRGNDSRFQASWNFLWTPAGWACRGVEKWRTCWLRCFLFYDAKNVRLLHHFTLPIFLISQFQNFLPSSSYQYLCLT